MPTRISWPPRCAWPCSEPTRVSHRDCVVCGAAQPVLQLSKDGYSMVRCRACGLLYVGEDPAAIDVVFADAVRKEPAPRRSAAAFAGLAVVGWRSEGVAGDGLLWRNRAALLISRVLAWGDIVRLTLAKAET